MATTVARLNAVLGADTKGFDRAMDKSDSKMRKAGRAAGVMGAALGGVLVAGLGKSVKEAMEAEKSQARLEKSFSRSVKGGIEPYRKSIENASKAAINLGFDDEDLSDSLGSLIIATKDYKKAQDLSNVAMDLARFKGISLEQATKMMTMAMAGSQRATKQLGIDVPKVTTTYDELKLKFQAATSEGGKHITMTEKMQLAAAKLKDKQATMGEVIDTVKDKVKGQADVYANTAEGGMEIMRVKIEELQEQLGAKLLPIMKDVIEALIGMLDWLEKHPKALKLMTIGVAALSVALLAAWAAQVALNLAVLANPYVAATVAVLAFVAGVVLLSQKIGVLKTAVILLLAPVSLLAAGFLLAYNMSGNLRNAVDNVLDKLKALGSWIASHTKFLFPLTSSFGTLFAAINKVIGAVKWLLDNIGKLGGALDRVIPGGGGGGGNERSSTGLVPKVQNALQFAGQQGWSGRVTSGFRTYAEQSRLYQRYLAGGPLAARPGTSSHEFGQAVDVTDYGTFGSIMNRAPSFAKLYNRLGARDPVHFSVTGYAKGGVVPGPIGMPQLAMVHGGETITPPGEMTFNMYVDGHKLFSWFRDAEKKDRRRNGR